MSTHIACSSDTLWISSATLPFSTFFVLHFCSEMWISSGSPPPFLFFLHNKSDFFYKASPVPCCLLKRVAFKTPWTYLLCFLSSLDSSAINQIYSCRYSPLHRKNCTLDYRSLLAVLSHLFRPFCYKPQILPQIFSSTQKTPRTFDYLSLLDIAQYYFKKKKSSSTPPSVSYFPLTFLWLLHQAIINALHHNKVFSFFLPHDCLCSLFPPFMVMKTNFHSTLLKDSSSHFIVWYSFTRLPSPSLLCNAGLFDVVIAMCLKKYYKTYCQSISKM